MFSEVRFNLTGPLAHRLRYDVLHHLLLLLPAQDNIDLLARILQQLDPAEALGSCALVSSYWRKAAALSIRAISCHKCTQPKATALSDWLQAYAVDGGSLTSISVANRSWVQPPPQLLLPLARLPGLQSLQVNELRVSAPGGCRA